jgi:hypothetical protein
MPLACARRSCGEVRRNRCGMPVGGVRPGDPGLRSVCDDRDAAHRSHRRGAAEGLRFESRR